MNQVRFGQWETNSSSVHQLVIDLSENKIEYPKQMTIRHKDYFEELSFNRSSKEYAEEKLMFVIASFGDPMTTLYAYNNLLKMFKEHGIEIIFDDKSFIDKSDPNIIKIKDTWVATSYELTNRIVDMVLRNDWDSISNFIFNDKSGLLTEDNNIYYDYPESKSKLFHEYDESKMKVFTDDY